MEALVLTVVLMGVALPGAGHPGNAAPPLEPTRPVLDDGESIDDLVLMLSGRLENRGISFATSRGDFPADDALVPSAGGTKVVLRQACRPGDWLTLTTGSRIGFLPEIPEDCSEPLPLELYPAASLSVAATFEDEVPPALGVEVYSCGFRGTIERIGRFSAPLADDGTATLTLPAGCTTARLTAPGHAPKRLRLDLRDDPRNIERIRTHFMLGGSLSARVVTSEAAPADGLLVTLIEDEEEASAYEATPSSREKDSANRTATTDEKGWFTFEGIASGRVHLHIDRGGDSRQATEWIPIKPGTETFIEDIVLVEPARLTVRLQAPDEVLESGLDLLGLRLTSIETLLHKKTSLDVNATDGEATFEGLMPGRWRIAAVARLGGSNAFLVGSEEIELLEADDRFEEFSIDGALYRGRVTSDGEPVRQAVMGLKPEKGSGNPYMRVQLGSDGKFAILLSRPGRYSASLEFPDRTTVQVPVIRFEDPSEVVQIELEGGSIAGRVLDSEGRPVEGAKVLAMVMFQDESLPEGEVYIRPNQQRTAADGTFQFLHASPGRWTLTASHERKRSKSETVMLEKRGRVDGIELVLGATRTIPVRVTNAHGMPVEGATVFVYPLQKQVHELSTITRGRTDATGTYDLEVPEYPAPADIMIVAGDALAVARSSLQGSEVPVTLDGPGGTIRLVRDVSDPWRDNVLHRLVAVDGSQIHLPFVWEKVSPTERIVRGLPAGRWIYAEAATMADIFRLQHGHLEGLVKAVFVAQPGAEIIVGIEKEKR